MHGFYDLTVRGQRAEQRVRKQPVQQAEQQSYPKPPTKQRADQVFERRAVRSETAIAVRGERSRLDLSDGLAHQRLTGVSKAVHKEGEKHKQLHHQRRRSQLHIAVTAADGCPAHIDDDET